MQELARVDHKFRRLRNVAWNVNQPVYRRHSNSIANIEWYLLPKVTVEDAIFFGKEPVIMISNPIENSIHAHKMSHLLYTARIMWERKCLAKSWKGCYVGHQVFIPILMVDETNIELRALFNENPDKIDFTLATFSVYNCVNVDKFFMMIRRLFSHCCLSNLVETHMAVELEEAVILPAVPEEQKNHFYGSFCAKLLSTGRFEGPFEYLFHQDRASSCGFVTVRTQHRGYNRPVILKIFKSETGCFSLEKRAMTLLGPEKYQLPSLLEIISVPASRLKILVYDEYRKMGQRLGSWLYLLEATDRLAKTLHALHQHGIQHGAIHHHNVGVYRNSLILTNFCSCSAEGSMERDKIALRKVLKQLDEYLPLSGPESSAFYSLLASI